MRILVISDTHGSTQRVFTIYEKLAASSPIDLIIHCGDFYTDALQIERKLSVPVTWVKGNCDGAYGDDDYKIVATEYGNLLVTHGHMEKVNFSQQNLYYKALESDCCAAVYGHTHRAVSTEAGGIYLFNPGSLTSPRDGSSGTFGLLTTSAESFDGHIYDYCAFLSDSPSGTPPEKTKVQGGFLRKLLNYSDRF